MRNIRDWCISRQLWWGHRIPAFTCANGHLTVAETDPKACETCGSEDFEQDPDVLDTWFSSQLWPFSVFGWPEETEDYREFYPTDTLVTGYDILFFWVARMIMAGIHFTGRAPFSVVHLHGLVRVGGEKMSKTRGNVIDPLEAIAEFGADAVRFTLAAAAASGPTVSVERGRMAGSRNFATKLWNAARFTLSQIEEKGAPQALESRAKSLPDRWILSRLNATAQAVNKQLTAFRFDEAAQAIYAFVWHELCDGYLEMVKPLLSAGKGAGGAEAAPEGAEQARETARGVLARCLADSLALLHPFMPFVTEEIREKMTGQPGALIVAAYPQGDEALRDEPAEKVVEALRAVVTRVRNFRTERGFSPTEPVRLAIDPDSSDRDLAGEIATLAPLLRHMARLSDLAFAPPGPEMSRDVLDGLSVGLAVARGGAGADAAKLAKTLVALDEEIASLSVKLRNTAFLDNAPPPVVDKARRRLVELEERRSALSTAGA
jgi:valyl-tRNA synthetase